MENKFDKTTIIKPSEQQNQNTEHICKTSENEVEFWKLNKTNLIFSERLASSEKE